MEEIFLDLEMLLSLLKSIQFGVLIEMPLRQASDGSIRCSQCDQIGQFFGFWATFKSLWQQLICPNLSHS